MKRGKKKKKREKSMKNLWGNGKKKRPRPHLPHG